ncbi:MAG: cytochrome C oxidase subunit IV family protein [Betaproteobacteria bacterium]|nr:cytochrome C oxidase subunit IV family protein [Betaproteobacteria bacterium]
MSPERRCDYVWIFLIGLTLVSAWIAEASFEAGLGITLLVAAIIGIKGRMVIDHFMELPHANRRIRFMMRLYFLMLPLITLLVHLFGDAIARATSIS